MEKEAYPPIPNIIEGRLNIKKINDLKIENTITNTEQKNLKKFFLINGEDGSTNFLKLSFSEKYFKPLVIISTSNLSALNVC